MTTFNLRNGYANRGKPGRLMTFRNPSDVAEIVSHCSANSHIWVRTQYNTAKMVKVNGAVRTWKRDANRIEVPCKYGLYEYFTLEARHITDILIPC